MLQIYKHAYYYTFAVPCTVKYHIFWFFSIDVAIEGNSHKYLRSFSIKVCLINTLYYEYDYLKFAVRGIQDKDFSDFGLK